MAAALTKEEFLDQLMSLVQYEANKLKDGPRETKYFLLRFAVVLTEYLLYLRRCGLSDMGVFGIGPDVQASHFLREEITPLIERFFRDPVKAACLHAELLIRVIKAERDWFQGVIYELLESELNPFFHAPPAS